MLICLNEIGATVESLLDQLNENENLFQIWDELATFTEQFGMYKSGGSSYDRSIYNNIYNGEEQLIHETKKYKIRIKQPRLSIFGAGHPHRVQILKMLKKEET